MKGMREMRLKKWVRVTLTVILIILAVIICSKIGTWGELAQNSRLYETLSVFSWIWIFVQPILIDSIWN